MESTSHQDLRATLYDDDGSEICSPVAPTHVSPCGPYLAGNEFLRLIIGSCTPPTREEIWDFSRRACDTIKRAVYFVVRGFIRAHLPLDLTLSVLSFFDTVPLYRHFCPRSTRELCRCREANSFRSNYSVHAQLSQYRGLSSIDGTLLCCRRHCDGEALMAIQSYVRRPMIAAVASHEEILKLLHHRYLIDIVETFLECKCKRGWVQKVRYLVVMHECKGGTLSERMRRAYMTQDEAREITRMVLEAVEFLHSRNVVHCHINFDNILFQDETDGSAIKVMLGSSDYGYVAPEVRASRQSMDSDRWESIRSPYSFASDMWSIGVMTCAMIFGSEAEYQASEEPKSKSEIIQLLQRNHPYFEARCSDACLDFVASLMEVDPRKRLSAGQALQHRWMAEESDMPIMRAPRTGKNRRHREDNIVEDIPHKAMNAMFQTDSFSEESSSLSSTESDHDHRQGPLYKNDVVEDLSDTDSEEDIDGAAVNAMFGGNASDSDESTSDDERQKSPSPVYARPRFSTK